MYKNVSATDYFWTETSGFCNIVILNLKTKRGKPVVFEKRF